MKIGKRIAVQTTLAEGSTMDAMYQFAETLDLVKYTDVTSASGWEKYGKHKYDEIFVREQIQAITFDACVTDEDKLACVNYSACTPIQSLTVTGVDESYIDDCNKKMARILKGARASRIEAIREEIGNEVLRGTFTYAESNTFLDDVKDIEEKYIMGGNPLFVYWLMYTNGYESTGYDSKAYYTAARKTLYIDILVNGNY
jgi:hypothetical protein